MNHYYQHSQIQFQCQIEQLHESHPDWVQQWLQCSSNSAKSGLDVNCAAAWAQESLSDALTWAYADENGKEIQNESTLTQAYFESRLPVVMRRLAAAAVRLAATLEYLLGGDEVGEAGPMMVITTSSSTTTEEARFGLDTELLKIA